MRKSVAIALILNIGIFSIFGMTSAFACTITGPSSPIIVGNSYTWTWSSCTNTFYIELDPNPNPGGYWAGVDVSLGGTGLCTTDQANGFQGDLPSSGSCTTTLTTANDANPVANGPYQWNLYDDTYTVLASTSLIVSNVNVNTLAGCQGCGTPTDNTIASISGGSCIINNSTFGDAIVSNFACSLPPDLADPVAGIPGYVTGPAMGLMAGVLAFTFGKRILTGFLR